MPFARSAERSRKEVFFTRCQMRPIRARSVPLRTRSSTPSASVGRESKVVGMLTTVAVARNQFTSRRSTCRSNEPRLGHVGADADAVAALSLVRALIRTLQAAGILSQEDVRAILNDASDQISHGGPAGSLLEAESLLSSWHYHQRARHITYQRVDTGYTVPFALRGDRATVSVGSISSSAFLPSLLFNKVSPPFCEFVI